MGWQWRPPVSMGFSVKVPFKFIRTSVPDVRLRLCTHSGAPRHPAVQEADLLVSLQKSLKCVSATRV